MIILDIKNNKNNLVLVLIVFTYFLLFLDTIKYPGFVEKHFFIDAKIYLAACVVLIPTFTTKNRFAGWIFRINLLVLAASGLGYIFFSIQEATHYPNFVLARFHFSLDGLIYVVIYSIALLIAEKITNLNLTKKEDISFGKKIIYFFVVYALVMNFGITFKTSLVGDIYIGMHYKDTYDQKMRNKWKNYYDYMVFVKQNTPEEATIIIPPQTSPWLRTGNVYLDRYFLYPRRLVQYNDGQIPDIASLNKGTYIMITWGDLEYDMGNAKLWPQQKIEAGEKIVKDSNTSVAKEIQNNVIFDPEDTVDPYGLLKI